MDKTQVLLKLNPSSMVRYFKCKALPLWTLPYDVIVHVHALHSIWIRMLSVYSFKGTISNHADWFSHWISTLELLTSQLLWQKERNLLTSYKINLGIVASGVPYIKFRIPISTFLQFLRIWFDFFKISGWKVSSFGICNIITMESFKESFNLPFMEGLPFPDFILQALDQGPLQEGTNGGGRFPILHYDTKVTLLHQVCADYSPKKTN